MPNITITIPNELAQEVADSYKWELNMPEADNSTILAAIKQDLISRIKTVVKKKRAHDIELQVKNQAEPEIT